MRLKATSDPQIIAEILKILPTVPGYEKLPEILERIGHRSLYIWGSAIREPIRTLFHPHPPVQISDLDLVVDDRDGFHIEEAFMPDQAAVNLNSHGSIKWRPNYVSQDEWGDTEIDISPLTDTNLNKINHGESTMGHVLFGSDFIPNALAFHVQSQTVFSHPGSLTAIKERVIDVLSTRLNRPQMLLPKLAILEKKIEFKLGDSAIQYVKEHYQNDTNIKTEIKEYLLYKKREHWVDYVFSRLEDIKRG